MFGEFEIDLDRGSLSRHGEELALRPKSFAMLQYLLEHAGQLVPRETLLAAVWPDVVVTDDSVAQCLIEIRRTLGDERREIVRTVPRRGLVFDIPVRAQGDGTPRTSSPRVSWLRLGLALVLGALAVLIPWWIHRNSGPGTAPAPVPPAPSIAVLRFTDLSSAGDQSYLADGLSEEIMHTLAQSPSLKVIARASSFAVEGRSIETIAAQLEVSHVLEGSVRREDGRIRVTAQLIDAATSSHVWSRSYDRRVDDILEVQREIARVVAQTLEVSLADGKDLAGIDPRAYALFLEGRHFYLRRADGDIARAQERFEQAIAISPGFARAWTGLSAVANARLHGPQMPPLTPAERRQAIASHRHATEQALRFGPDLPEAQVRAAAYFYSSGERERAREHVEIARSIDPDHWLVRAMLGNELRFSGRIDECIELFRLESRRDPLNLVLRDNLVVFLVWAGRFGEAAVELERALALVPPESVASSGFVQHEPKVRLLTGQFEAAAKSLAAVPDDLQRRQLQALVFHGMGRQAEFQAALEQIRSAPPSPWRDLYAAEVLAYSGAGAEAMAQLREIQWKQDCTENPLTQSVYYSPFLAKLEGTPDWESYRAGVLDSMKACMLGLDVDPV